MKKRLLSALLALALVFVLLPTAALAGVTTKSDYDISINGTGWKFERDNTSGAYIPAYYYHTNEFSADENYRKLYTNDNLMLTKEGNTVTITIRRGTSHDHRNYPIEFTLKKESIEKNDVPCIKMGNDNNLVITGKGTLNITRNESKSYGAALYSNVGDITINGGITVNVSFLNGKDYYNKNASSNAIYVGDNHNLTVSGSGTNVTATNQGFDSSPATVCVEGGTITVSGGASLSATNTYADNFSGSSVTQHFKSYAISGTESKPCTLIVADEKSSVTAWAYDEKYGKPFGFVTYNITGATVKAGSSAYYATETTIDNINGKEYVKISVPALETTADVLIAKENAVVGVRTSLGEGNGYYTYNKDTKTLTLEDVSITNVAHFIQFWAKDSYTIELKGTNTITGVTSAIRVPEKGYNNESLDGLNVTITGTGSLNVTANTYAIDMQVGNLIFNSTGNITLTTNTNYLVQATVRNALHVAGNVTIDKTKYDIVGVKQDIEGTRENISDNPNLDTILKGTDSTLYFKTITITPAAAKPSTISYGNKTLKQGEIIKGEISGTATVDSKNNTITLDNFKGNYPLEFNAEFTPNSITLIGDSTLSAVETKYQNLTISGSGSLTVGSIRVPNNTQHTANLTITGGAHVTVNRPSSEDKPAVEVSGNLTVTGDGTQLSAECTAATNPAIEVGGNVTISGNPGTNAYTVKAYNKYATQRGRDDKLRPSQMPSAIEISGDSLSISNSARVMAKTDSDGAAVWMPAQKVISVADASLIAQNRSHNFSTISFGDESNMGNIYAKGQEVNIVAENMLGSNSSLAHKAIKAFIYNHYNTGDSNPYYIKVVSEGVQSGGNVNVIPGHCTSTVGYKVTITRGDAYSAPTTISKIIITGLTPPVKGETPATTGVSLGTGLTVTEVTWGGTFTSDGEFKADESYTAHIKYTVDAGYMLATDAQCQDISAADTVRLNKSESQVEVTFHTAANTTHQHTSETGWQTDGTNHWKICSDCLQRYNEGACTISGYNNDNGASGYHKVLCSVGHVMKTESHDYEYKITQDGTMHYKECKTCHYTTLPVSHNFGSSGTESCECGTIPSHTHNLSGQKGNDETNHWDICSECSQHVNEAPHTYGDWITDTPATDTTDGSKHRTCSVCQYQENATIPKTGTGEIVPPTPDNPGTIVIIRPAEEEKPAQQPNPSTGANDLVGLAVAAAVAAALGSAALLRKHD